MGKQVEGLEDHAHFAANGVDITHVVGQGHAVDDNFAALVLFQPVDGANESRFPEPDGPKTTTTSRLLIEVETPRRA